MHCVEGVGEDLGHGTCRIPWYKLHLTWNDCGECATITCALRWGVAFVGVISSGRDSPFMGKTF